MPAWLLWDSKTMVAVAGAFEKGRLTRMPYDRERLERFAMQAEHASKEVTGFAGWIEIDAIGDQLGLPHDDARQIAFYLQEIGWAKTTNHGNPKLMLLPLGFEEIAKLKWPKWKRWLAPQLPMAFSIPNLITTTIAIIALLVSLLKR